MALNFGINMVIILIIWMVCSVLSYGLFFAWIRNYEPGNYKKDIVYSIIASTLGPISLIIVFIVTISIGGNPFKYGLRFW